MPVWAIIPRVDADSQTPARSARIRTRRVVPGVPGMQGPGVTGSAGAFDDRLQGRIVVVAAPCNEVPTRKALPDRPLATADCSPNRWVV